MMTLEEDRAEIEHVTVSWQGITAVEQENMLTSLGRMLDYLDPTDDAEYQLSLDAERLRKTIEAAIRHEPTLAV